MKIYLLTSSDSDEYGNAHEQVTVKSVFTSLAAAQARGNADHVEFTKKPEDLDWKLIDPPSTGAHGGLVATAEDYENGAFYYVRELEVLG